MVNLEIGWLQESSTQKGKIQHLMLFKAYCLLLLTGSVVAKKHQKEQLLMAGKFNIPTNSTPTSQAVTPSGTGMNSFSTAMNSSGSESFGTSPALEMTKNTSANEMFRKPTSQQAARVANSFNNTPTISNITMPRTGNEYAARSCWGQNERSK